MLKKTLVALAVCLVPGAAFAGRVGGPKRHIDSVLPQKNDIYNMAYHGGRNAIVQVTGDHSTDLDCWVYDEDGDLVDSDTDSTDICWLNWTPIWTGNFTIKIRNHGYVPNIYVIESN